MPKFLSKFAVISVVLVFGAAHINDAYAAPSSAPKITKQPVNVTVTAPAKASFTVTASGNPAPTYQWKQEAPGANTFTSISKATSTSYTIATTTTANSGTKYECVVTNTAGNVTSNAVTLTVNPALVAPSISAQPANATVTAPAKASFTVSATGNPTPTYQWKQEASGARTYTTITGATSASYTTAATTTANSGTKYECVVTNSVGSVTSNAATLTVNPALIAPSITTQPLNATVKAPAKATFTVTASGTPAPTYQWKQSVNGGAFTNISGATKSSYTTAATTVSESGTQYECVVTNTSGSVTSAAAILTVYSTLVSPKITTQPVNATVTAPATATFTVTATGTPAPSYQWMNEALGAGSYAAITGATSASYTTPPTTTANSGTRYECTVTNVSGSVTSAAAILTVTAPMAYDIDGNLISETDALGHTTNYQYDNLNRLTKTVFADGSTLSYAYDAFGNQTSVTDQRGNTLTKTYDNYERLSQIKDPNGGITQFTYDTEGHLLSLTDANGHVTSYTYDPNGKVLTQTNALNFTTSFAYDPVGNVSSRTDANGKTTTYAYDTLNRLISSTYPDGTSVANTYDALGRKTLLMDATGQTSYIYDALNRLLTKTSPGTNNTITYTYDSEGNRLTSVDQNNRSIANTYDALNRLASVTDPEGTTSYGYDGVSNKISVKNPNGEIESYTFDALNRVLSAVNATSSNVISSFNNVYDAAGMITKKTFQDGSWTAYRYDALNRLLEETKQTSSAIVYDYVYSYDPAGNRLTWTKNTTLGGFWNVDSLNMPPQVLTNMTIAGYGKTSSPTQVVSLARSYNYDAANRLNNWNYGVNIYSASFPVQTDTYAYDQNGNRLSKQAVLTGGSMPQQTNYSYDFENRLNQSNYTNIPGITGTQTDSLIYNGEGLRTQVVANSIAANYLYDGSNILVERDGSGNTTKSYTRGLDFGGGIGSLINQNYTASGTAVTQYYDYNDLGSTADLTSTAGALANSYNYDAFGNLLTPQSSGDANRYLFSSKEFDSRSGLYYFGARYYDPEIGRWLTPDPLGFVNGPNMYAYVGNNPVNWVDPYGLQEFFGPEDIIDEGGGDSTSTGSGGSSQTSDQVGNGGQSTCKGGVERNQPWTGGYPGDNPNVPPGPGFVWKGNGTPESGDGNWYNPETGQSLNPDLNHPPPKGPHWGYQDRNGNKSDIFPDGSIA